MDRRDEIIRLQMEVIGQMTRSNLQRLAADLWDAPPAAESGAALEAALKPGGGGGDERAGVA